MTDIHHQKLSHPDSMVRKSAAQALCRAGAIVDLPALQRALVLEQDARVIKWIALALAKTGDYSSLALLEPKLKDVTNEDARDWITVSGGMLLGVVNQELDLQRIHKLLGSESTDARKEGVLLSWHVTDLPANIRKRLLAQVDHQDAAVRRWSILSLGNSTLLPSTASIITHLTDDDYLVREWTEHVLATIKDPQVFMSLIERLKDPHPRVREWAVKAIAAYEMPGVLTILIAHFGIEQDELCREGIIVSLRKWCNIPQIKEFLLKTFVTENSFIVLSALIDLIHAAPTLKTDPLIIETLLETHSVAVEPMLHAQVLRTILNAYTVEELERVGLVLGSRKSRLLVEFLEAHGFNNTALILPEHSRAAVPLISLDRSLLRPTSIFITGASDAKYTSRECYEQKKSVDFGIVIALKEEFREFASFLNLQMISVIDHDTDDIFYEFEEAGISGKCSYTCVAVLIAGMGPSKASIRTERLLAKYAPKTVINVGISAGIHKDIQVGDVVIAQQVDGYIESSKAITSDSNQHFQFELSGDVFHTSRQLMLTISNFEFTKPAQFDCWRQSTSNNLTSLVPDQVRSTLVASGTLSEMSRLHEAHIASGPVVGASSHFTEWLLARDRKYQALDMESVGFMDSATSRKNPPNTLVIRGISDYGDDRKPTLDNIQGGVLRKLAMQNALSFLWTLLKAETL